MDLAIRNGLLGVVTDIGGPLSHSSIVAREYGIPAVLGTAVATRRIQSGQQIKVDGDAGTVTLLDGHEPQEVEQVTKISCGARSSPPQRARPLPRRSSLGSLGEAGRVSNVDQPAHGLSL